MKPNFKLLNILILVAIFCLTSFMVFAEEVVVPNNADANAATDATAPAPEAKKEEKKEEKSWTDKVEVSGTAFLHYGYKAMNKGKDDAENTFNVNRAYLTVKAKPADKLSVRVTGDFESEANDSGKYRYFYLKYGYATYKPMDFVNVTFGLMKTHWVGWVDDNWGYRILSKSLLDKYGLCGSTDVGLAIHSGVKEPKDRIAGMIEYYVGLTNGVGYKHFEEAEDDLKNFSLRLGIVPVDGDMKAGLWLGYLRDFNTPKDIDGDGAITSVDTKDLPNKNAEHIFSLLGFIQMKNLIYAHVEGFYGMYDTDTDVDDPSTALTKTKFNYMGIGVNVVFSAVPDLLDVVAQFEYIDPTNENIAAKYAKFKVTGKDDTQMSTMFGINYKLDKKMLWIIPNVTVDWLNIDGVDDKQTNLAVNVDVQAKF